MQTLKRVAEFSAEGRGAKEPDVNADGNYDLLDLTLMGGNYDKTSSTWTP